MFEITLRTLYHIGLSYIRTPRFNIKSKCIETQFRCWPIDLDIFLHMNNAKYVRVAELSRWSVFPSSGMMSLFRERGVMFLVVDQRIQYFKSIVPYQKYTVQTSIVYSQKNDKWLYYIHTFVQDPSTVLHGKDPIVYANVKVKVTF